MVQCPMDLEPDVEVRCGALLVQVMAREVFILQEVGPEFTDSLFLREVGGRHPHLCDGREYQYRRPGAWQGI